MATHLEPVLVGNFHSIIFRHPFLDRKFVGYPTKFLGDSWEVTFLIINGSNVTLPRAYFYPLMVLRMHPYFLWFLKKENCSTLIFHCRRRNGEGYKLVQRLRSGNLSERCIKTKSKKSFFLKKNGIKKKTCC